MSQELFLFRQLTPAPEVSGFQFVTAIPLFTNADDVTFAVPAHDPCLNAFPNAINPLYRLTAVGTNHPRTNHRIHLFCARNYAFS